jgi:uncharacterized coiled-coil protein SlyX
MNQIDIEYFQGLEKRLAELEAKIENFILNDAHREMDNFTINRRLNELESQVCGAKKGRMDKIDEMLDALEGHSFHYDKLEERVKRLEGLAYVTEVKQPDGTVDE